VPPTAWFYEPQRSWHVVFQQWHTSKVENYDIYDLRGHLIELHANPSLDRAGLHAGLESARPDRDVGAPVADSCAVAATFLPNGLVPPAIPASSTKGYTVPHPFRRPGANSGTPRTTAGITTTSRDKRTEIGNLAILASIMGPTFGFETNTTRPTSCYFSHDNLIRHLTTTAGSGTWSQSLCQEGP
jgi:hypothetical protein